MQIIINSLINNLLFLIRKALGGNVMEILIISASVVILLVLFSVLKVVDQGK